MQLDLNSLQLRDNVQTVVCIDYDNKTHTFGKLSQLKDDVKKLMSDIQLFVFQGPDASLAVSSADYPQGTVVYELPALMMKRDAQPAIAQAADNQIVMFVTALGLKPKSNNFYGVSYGSSYGSGVKTVYIVSGGDKRYVAVQHLANSYFPNIKVKLLDVGCDSIYDVLSEYSVCARCKIVFTGNGPNSKYMHQVETCSGCKTKYCKGNKEDADKHALVSWTMCSKAAFVCYTTFPGCCTATIGQQHHDYHVSRGDKVCGLCPADRQGWLAGNEYDRHMRNTHQMTQCPHCQENLVKYSDKRTAHLLEHFKELAKTDPDSFVACPMCEREMKVKNFKSHYNKLHGVDGTVPVNTTVESPKC